MFSDLALPFVQRGLLEVLLLSVGAGLIGTFIVLRGQAFFSHAVGTAAFPGLVLADGLGFSAALGAFGTALLVAALVTVLGRRRPTGQDAVTALVLVAALAVGVVLASDVFHSGSGVDSLLFGSLLLINDRDLVLAAAASVVVALAVATVGGRWLADGFDPDFARATRARLRPDLLLFALIALVAVASLAAVGALLATALLVIPAATTRLWAMRMRTWQVATVALVLVEGCVGMVAAVELNAPPGPAIAVLAGAVFALAAVLRALGTGVRAPAVAAAALAVGALLAGCGSGEPATGGRLPVVATTTQLGDLVRAVGGDRVAVTQILRPNTDPHEYEPRPSDVKDTAAADVVFVNGDGLDRWADTIVRESGTDARVVDVGATVPVRRAGEPGGEQASAVDPHWWHDPVNVRAAARTVARALAAADPAHAAAYRAGAARYDARVRRLDAVIRRCLRAVPPADRVLVTDHDALGYYARRYGLDVVGTVIPSQSTRAQASARALADLVAVIRREGVRAVFPETSVNTDLARAIAARTGASADRALYGDTLGPAGSPGATYLGMELANTDAIVRGLTGGRVGCRPGTP